MSLLFITREEWNNFLKGKIKEVKIFAPFEEYGKLFLSQVNNENIGRIVYNRARTVEPLKIFFFPIRERIVEHIENPEKFVLLGITSCDLKGLDILDSVFLKGEFKDPNYGQRRENTLLISIDCSQPYDTCFCESVGTHPYPEKNFDINLSPVGEGFVVEVGTDKGKEFIGSDKRFFNATNQQIEKRTQLRKQTQDKIKEINRDFNIENSLEKLKGLYSTEYWEKIDDIKKCVQCGSCTSNCPSCVCFFLDDISENGNFKKLKFWDSCLFPGYAQMASGATPRPTLFDRYANRILCKYDYMISNFGMKGCTGCGRCIEGCIGKIDKRKVISEIVKEVVK